MYFSSNQASEAKQWNRSLPPPPKQNACRVVGCTKVQCTLIKSISKRNKLIFEERTRSAWQCIISIRMHQCERGIVFNFVWKFPTKSQILLFFCASDWKSDLRLNKQTNVIETSNFLIKWLHRWWEAVCIYKKHPSFTTTLLFLPDRSIRKHNSKLFYFEYCWKLKLISSQVNTLLQYCIVLF